MSYYTKITTVGLAAITAAMNNNSKVPISYMAFGDGNGSIPEPNETATSLVNEVYRVGVNKVEIHNKNPNWLVCEAIIPSAVGGFNIREVALYDKTGNTMLAVASYPPTYKPSIEEGAAKIQMIRIVIQVDNSGNFELIIDPDIVLATIEYVDNKNNSIKADIDQINGKIDQTSIFGSSGMAMPIGANQDAHYGWGGILNFESDKWVFIYRKGTNHAIKNNSELRAIDSYDQGRNWTNDRLITVGENHDLRPDPPKMMANNRGGIFVNRQSETAGLHNSPYFISTDDEGQSWKIKTINTSSPYTFQSTGGILEFPSAVGGHDELGFMAFGFLSATGLDAFTTIDNGETWQQHDEVAIPSGDVVGLSEWSGCRIGDQNKWVFFTRSTLQSGWNKDLIAFITTDPLNWGDWHKTGLELGGNPPMCLYDDDSQDLVLLNVSRGGRPIGSYPENSLLQARVNGDEIYSNNANFLNLNIKYNIIANLPHWLTGYLAPFKDDNKWFTTLTCGEAGFNGGGSACQILLGDFIPAATELTKVVNFLIKQQKTTSYLEVTSTDDSTYPVRIYSKNRAGYINVRPGYMDFNPEGPYSVLNSSKPIKMNAPIFFGGLDSKIDGANASIHAHVDSSNSPAMRTISESTSVRQHYVFHNLNGVVGSITTNGSGTIFNTTSDETLKSFNDEFSGEDALKIIKSDPVRNYKWNATNEKSIGWGAQTSYGISPDLASKGGWYNEEGAEVPEGTENSTYIRWGMDYSRRAPYLWAAVAHISKQIEELQAKLNQ